MLWANMALHMSADPQHLIQRWHQTLAVDGFLMFSCLGPDSLREIRAVYHRLGWPAPSHEFTDMHDWGDMLVAAGFAEPVLDMERIVLTFATPERLLAELRTLGRNLHPARFPSLRGRGWLLTLQNELKQESKGDALSLTFEVIYGHALKPKRRLVVQPEMRLSLDEMRKQFFMMTDQMHTFNGLDKFRFAQRSAKPCDLVIITRLKLTSRRVGDILKQKDLDLVTRIGCGGGIHQKCDYEGESDAFMRSDQTPEGVTLTFLHMNRQIMHTFGGFHDGFGDGWVGVDDAA